MGVSQRADTTWGLGTRLVRGAGPQVAVAGAEAQPRPGALTIEPAEAYGTASRHLPAFATLEFFGVPFATYDVRGRRLYASPPACALLDDEGSSYLLRAECEWLVSESLGAAVGEWNGDSAWDHMMLEVGACALTAYRVAAAPSHLQLLDRTALVVVFGPLRTQGADALDHLEPLGLTPREREVAGLISAGLSTKELAAKLGISVHTAKRHTERVYRKLGVHGRVAMSRAIRTLRLTR